MSLKERMNKRCPRCGTKSAYATVICPNCSLNYQKFDQATNKVAKQKLKEGEKEQVLMRKGCPADVKWWKLLLMAIFLGFVGGHHYYVGRVKMGLFYSITLVVYMVVYGIAKLVGFSYVFMYDLYMIAMLMWGVVLLMWIIDVAKICLSHYKIPVSREE